MGEYLQAFLLGNSAILGNVCVLPLYPGLIAFLGGTAEAGHRARSRMLLGIAVLAGVLTVMVALGFVLHQLQLAFSSIFDWFLPLIYGVVLVLGVAMLAGKNPFARMQTSRAPVVRNPFATAFAYGALLGPMTLPCTGPIILSAFVLGAGDPGSLVEGLLYFVAFGIGFGWPLVVLPAFATPVQRRFTQFTTQHHVAINRFSGALLIAVAAFGFWVDVAPNLG